jgi:hypothetical protein
MTDSELLADIVQAWPATSPEQKHQVQQMITDAQLLGEVVQAWPTANPEQKHQAMLLVGQVG